MKRAARPLLVTVLASTLLLSGALPSSAQGEGFWYFDVFHVGSAHSAGFTGQGVTIAVIDGQINPDVPTLKNANIEVQDPLCLTDDFSGLMPAISDVVAGPGEALHGTNVASLIAGTGEGYPGQTGVKGVAPGAKVLYYSAWVDQGNEPDSPLPVCTHGEFLEVSQGPYDAENNDWNDVASAAENNFPEEAMADAMNKAMDAGADIISISAGGRAGSTLSDALGRAAREGVVVVGAMPNSSDFVFNLQWPARANSVVSVQALGADAQIQQSSGVPNKDSDTDVAGAGLAVVTQGTAGGWNEQDLGWGTSYATPVVAGFLAVVKSKYPDATGNQLIQTLIRNTGTEPHELAYDPDQLIGYGAASLTSMLAVDPTQYPDENPLIDLDGGDPSYDQIFNPVEPTPDPVPIEDPSGQDVGSDLAGLLTSVTIFALVGLVVTAGIVVSIVVLVRRSGRKAAAIDPAATPPDSENV